MAIIDKPTDYFNTKLYTGTGSNNITLDMDNIGFLWIKRRNATGGHVVFDSVRGGYYTGSGARPVLLTNSTSGSQGTDINSAIKGINFGSTSTVIGSDSQGYNYNASGGTYVAWHWGTGGTTSSNTDGSITSSVSANTTSGFSIVSYTGNGSAGATIGHGLGTAPHLIIMKDRSNVRDWFVYHQSTGETNRLKLNSTVASAASTFLNDTAPTSSVYAVDGGTAGNASSANYIAYCFAEKQGYSKFGSYTGNGSADGTFVYTGFKPAFVMVKRTDSAQSWYMLDNKRNTFNPVDKYLLANTSAAEDTFIIPDFLSNGFKLRGTGSGSNASGGSFIYMAFAENPFVTSTGVPATAR